MYLLPAIVAAFLIGEAVRGRQRPTDARLDQARTVRRLGLLFYGLALRALLMVIPELMAFRETGTFPSLMVVNVFWPLGMALLFLPVGLGLRQFRPWARWAAVFLSTLNAALAVLVLRWMIRNEAAVYPWDWPDIAVARALPFFTLFVLIRPSTSLLFRAQDRAELMADLRAHKPVRSSPTALACLGFLIVLASIDGSYMADWTFRYGPLLFGLPEG